MIDDHHALVIAERLTPHQVKALRELARTVGHFENPVGPKMTRWLLEQGFAEQGFANEYTGKIGYRLSPFGSRVWSALSKRRRKERSGIRTLEPLIPTLDPRIGTPIKK